MIYCVSNLLNLYQCLFTEELYESLVSIPRILLYDERCNFNLSCFQPSLSFNDEHCLGDYRRQIFQGEKISSP
jgi:hypothetical protein